ncbi:jacalin-related lectin 3-like [Triticum aestivum]|uniref:jacalin-related lectin 3-like n=1 Tax=Triticum aestivum TaxID=4565 RepID=UPI001D01985D|nr:jacalin-related lectin 3-like [Triticum aestivum]
MQRHAGDELTISVDPDTLDCPICFHTLRPPVFQCGAGHMVCQSCRDRLQPSSKCPACSVTTGFGRCYAVKRILRSVRVPCPNTARGCAVRTSLHEREEHEKSCASILQTMFLLRHGLSTVTINDKAKAGEVVRMGPCGGVGGNDRKIGMVGDVRRIVQVAVRHCRAVDAIRVTYMRKDREETELWGGKGGMTTVFRLQQDEYLTSVEGHYSHFNGNVVIRSLKFASNLRTHGPYGNACGVWFSLPAGAGCRIIGFHARCDDQYLHAIGTYVKMDDRAS